MSNLQAWLLRFLFRRIFAGDWQYRNLVEINKIMGQELGRRFPEDNVPTTACFMRDALADSFRDKWDDHFIRGIFNTPQQEN